MSILTLTSYGTSPGVSTAAMAMALQWPRPVLLLEADVSKPSTAVAGWLQGSMPADTGLMGVAHASFRQTVSEQDIWDYAVDITAPDTPAVARWLMPAVAEPRAARSMRTFWPELMPVLRVISDRDIDVVIDAGRLDEAHGREPLWREADHVGVMLRSDLVSVAAARAYLPEVLAARADLGAADTLSLLVVEDRAQQLASKDIATVLGASVRARLPYSPEAASHYGGGARAAQLRLRSYNRAISAANASIGEALRTRRELIEKAEMKGAGL